MSETEFLIAFGVIMLTIGSAYGLALAVKDLGSVVIGGIRFILDPKADQARRKNQVLNGLGWLSWIVAFVAGANHSPAWLTLFLVASILHTFVFFNGRRLRRVTRETKALAWIQS